MLLSVFLNILRGDFINWTVVVGVGLFVFIVSLVSYRLIKNKTNENNFENISLLICGICTIYITEVDNILKSILMIVVFIFVVVYITILILKKNHKK
ncbi:hypothetical protein D3C76_545760 [compost metagenome]